MNSQNQASAICGKYGLRLAKLRQRIVGDVRTADEGATFLSKIGFLRTT